MPNDDDDDWYDDDDKLEETESVPCPECGGVVHSVSDKCPSCGYWLSDSDRHALWPGTSKPRWLIVTAWVVLAVFLIPLIAIILSLFKRGPAIVQ